MFDYTFQWKQALAKLPQMLRIFFLPMTNLII